jgi:hypothetical protein
VNVGAQTILQIARPAPAPLAPAASAPAPLAPATSHAPAPGPALAIAAKQTMIGVASPLGSPMAGMQGTSQSTQLLAVPSSTQLLAIPGGVAPTAPPGTAPPAAHGAQAASPVSLKPSSKTMLGVAMPGIAPTLPPDEAAPPPVMRGASGPGQGHAQGPMAQAHRAPALTLPLQVQYVPPPEPLRELSAPLPPRIVRKKGGFPLAAVALVMGVLVLAGGVVLALFWKGAPPITGQARATPEGKDVLHLVCDAKSCKDGTAVTIGGVRAVFTGGQADVPLATPLHVGDNALQLNVDRPGMGRDETVRLVVPVAYRVSADVSTMGAAHPSITIRVEASPTAQVSVDGKPLALDANGAGAYTLDETAAAEGAADESRVVSADVPYTIAVAGHAADHGKVSARVAVAPLRSSRVAPRRVPTSRWTGQRSPSAPTGRSRRSWRCLRWATAWWRSAEGRAP